MHMLQLFIDGGPLMGHQIGKYRDIEVSLRAVPVRRSLFDRPNVFSVSTNQRQSERAPSPR